MKPSISFITPSRHRRIVSVEAGVRVSRQRHVRDVLGRHGAELIAAYEAGASAAALAADAGISENTLRIYFTTEGIPSRPRVTGRSRKRLDASKAELIAAYEAGATLRSLAAGAGVSEYTLRAYLTAEGIALRRYTDMPIRPRKIRDASGAELIAANKACATVADLADRDGVTRPTVYAFLKAEGVALRDDRGRTRKRRRADE